MPYFFARSWAATLAFVANLLPTCSTNKAHHSPDVECTAIMTLRDVDCWGGGSPEFVNYKA